MGHIYDKEFIQKELPMTKQEVRAISIAKLQLEDDSILIDVGAGTGTIGIEAATYLRNGKVYSIEKEEKGIETLNENINKFCLKNIEVIVGRAPQVIPKIKYDRMFIGGSTGSLKSILEHFMEYSKSKSRVVINAITLETLADATKLLKELKLKNIEVINVAISRGKNVGPYTMMYGENPIYIITADRED
ncbi:MULTISPECIES: precorrin-6Y C5,15-methyltransferase (decarboxylating) subunit CbiT [Cetobacterium]|uniref:Precorrin-6Y C5,15-methyltransferase (Decarboxylating) subunit CbiT n=1 Tax=Candidatus Cetobacterium colombiensis TaxID=3073100 RepID=A0ABU4W9G9_9FUSO|nr:precorrin-6Y C5,15-methyltransferase (decarboxylating) subunit CbiT [Candidatus Cetobacterium colombiensis]MDX8335138.1 precorrin-6Y C5,15-methyltransferase (decarboxylating) subunit CbiT [Candidatus Cetobacterium colombiensis]